MRTRLDDVRVQRVLLDQVKISLSQVFTEWDLDDMEIREFLDYSSNRFVCQFQMYFAGREHKRVEVILVPDTWWDMFKQRFFPKMKFKTRKIEKEVYITNICPHLPKGDHKNEHIEFVMREGLHGHY